MGDRPTFHLADDYVALTELTPCARNVYSILRCNAEFSRNAAVNHAVHVTSSWFTEMTSHWKRPLSGASARRGMAELIEKKILLRLNEPNDGMGFLVAFVADPRGLREGPVNGFEHAKRVARRTGVGVYYERRDELPGTPAVTGVRLGSKNIHVKSGQTPKVPAQADPSPHEEAPAPTFDEPTPPAVNDSSSGNETGGTEVTDEMRRFAELLGERTARMADANLRLMPGACQRIAEAVKPALELGWDPRNLANRLASSLNSRIHSPEQFLLSKVGDIGTPPSAAPHPGADVDTRELEGVREVDVRPCLTQEPQVDQAEEVLKEEIYEQYRKQRARWKMAGSGF
jgi:hypothetical protein